MERMILIQFLITCQSLEWRSSRYVRLEFISEKCWLKRSPFLSRSGIPDYCHAINRREKASSVGTELGFPQIDLICRHMLHVPTQDIRDQQFRWHCHLAVRIVG